MEFKVVSIALVILAICAIGRAQSAAGSNPSGPGGPVGPPPFCEIYKNILLAQANRIVTPDLPEDLLLRVAEVLENANQGCAACDGLIIWQNKICLVGNLQTGLAQLMQIKNEADARKTSAAPAVTPAQ